MKGKLIVIDGVDAVGKRTQTKLLVESLNKSGIITHAIDFPRYQKNLIADVIRNGLDNKLNIDFLSLPPKVASIFYAADRAESREEIENWLSSGDFVVADRYVSANQIHQGGKLHSVEEREQFLSWLDELEFGRLKLPRPDVILYLDLPIEVSIELARLRAEEKGLSLDVAEAGMKHQQEAKEGALHLIEKSNNWFRISCAQNGQILSREEIHHCIRRVLQEKLGLHFEAVRKKLANN